MYTNMRLLTLEKGTCRFDILSSSRISTDALLGSPMFSTGSLDTRATANLSLLSTILSSRIVILEHVRLPFVLPNSTVMLSDVTR